MEPANDTTVDKGADTEEAGDEAAVAEKGTDTTEKGTEDKGDKDKPSETPEARKSRLERELERHLKKHPHLAEQKEKPQAPGKKGELDYGQKAFLIASGIKEQAEIELVQRGIKESGLSLEQLLANGFFQAQLKELRDQNAADDATPSGKRSGQPSRDSVDYWIAKGGLPEDTPANRELRTKIVNARLKGESSSSNFASQSVVK